MFENQNPPTVPDQSTVIKFKVGDREYDPSSAATKIEHADKHISTLEQELASERQRLALLEAQLKAKEALSNPNTGTPPATTAAVPSVNEIVEQVQRELDAQRDAALKAQNVQSVVQLAKTIYGEEALDKLAAKGAELGMSKDDITKFAAEKPEAFKALFGLAQSGNPQKPSPKSSATFSTAGSEPNPIQDVAKLIVNRGVSARDRTAAIAALLSKR